MSRASRPRNQLQEEQRARTRASITRAALQVFAEVGYVGTTIEHILVHAGVSRAAFYSHFDGKQGVVQAIAEDFAPAWEPIFGDLAELRNPGLPELTEWASRHLEFFRSNLDACTILSQVIELEEAFYWQVAGHRDALIHMLANHHRAFAVAKTDDAVMLEARILLINVDQICFHVAHKYLPNPGDTAAKIIATQILSFLRSHGGHEPADNDQ